jgi:hypothetical protein
MPKYRHLTKDELAELEKEFVEYLILNGVGADDWVKIKEQDKPKAEKFLELFSDVVFESVLRKIKFLEYREKNSLQVFQCLPEHLVVVSMTADKSEEVDFTDPQFLSRATVEPPASLKVLTATKSYKKEREAELFEMLQIGCVITDDKLFKTLCLMVK